MDNWMSQHYSRETFMIVGITRDEAEDQEQEEEERTKRHAAAVADTGRFSDDYEGGIRLLNANRLAFLSGDDCNIWEATQLKCLSHVHIYQSQEEENLQHSSHHQRMKCLCGGSGGGVGEIIIFPDVSFLQELGSLRIFFRVRPGDEILLSNIKELSLRESGLAWEKMSIIGKLPNLHALTLIHNTFVGNVWETRDGEFRKLKYLMFGFSTLFLWMVSHRAHFPSLECLVIGSSSYLQEIPGELGYLPTLQIIEVVNCRKWSRLALSAIRIEDEQRKYGNDKLQVIIVNRDGGEIPKDQIKLYQLRDAFNNCISMKDCLKDYYKAGGSEGFLEEEQGRSQKLDIRRARMMFHQFRRGKTLEKVICKIRKFSKFRWGGRTPIDDPLLLWSPCTFSLFVSYVGLHIYPNLKKNGLSDHTIIDLWLVAESYLRRKQLLPGYSIYHDEIGKTGLEFTELLVNSFIPQVLEFFQVPKLLKLRMG